MLSMASLRYLSALYTGINTVNLGEFTMILLATHGKINGRNTRETENGYSPSFVVKHFSIYNFHICVKIIMYFCQIVRRSSIFIPIRKENFQKTRQLISFGWFHMHER